MLSIATIVGILIYLKLASGSVGPAVTFLLAFGLTVAVYTTCCHVFDRLHRHKILIQKHFSFNRIPLSTLLDRRIFDVIQPPRHGITLAELTSLFPPPDLIILHIDFSNPIVMARLRTIRRSRRFRHVPIFGVVASGSDIDLDIRTLRLHGILGLVTEEASPEAVVQSVNCVVGSVRSRRPPERANCIVPVEVTSGRRRTSEHAMNLSASGLQMTSVSRTQPGSDLHLSFRLPMISNEPVRASGRVVYQMPTQTSEGRYVVGVRFDSIDPRSHKRIQREVSRLLSA